MSWLGMEEQNLIQQHHAFSNQNKRVTSCLLAGQLVTTPSNPIVRSTRHTIFRCDVLTV